MRLHADLRQRVVLDTTALPWTPTPCEGVERKMLDRIGEEVARATSLVRFGSGSRFARHEHGAGEEIFVLEGVLADEHGRYPAGTYLRNPAGTSHEPFSAGGCTLWVKLRQMDPADRRRAVIDANELPWEPAHAPGLSIKRLHERPPVTVALLRFAPGTRLGEHIHRGGEELFVLEGELCDELGRYPVGTWVRQPAGSHHSAWTEVGATLLSKSGHLLPGSSGCPSSP